MDNIQIPRLNERMIKGLKGFHKGLVEHGIILRSKIKNQTFQETIKKELNDMNRFQKEIYRIKDPEIRELTRALTEYACAFYKLVKEREIENYNETIEYLDKLYSKINDESNSKEEILIKALIKYIISFNKLIEKNGVENYKKTIDFINKYYFEMDNKFYSELEGKPNDMKLLAEYLSNKKIKK